MYRTIGIVVVTPPFDRNTRERSLSGPVDDPEIVADVARGLFEEFHGDTVRKLGVRISKLSYPDHDQEALDAWADDGATDGVDHGAIRQDQTRDRHGEDGQAGLDDFA